MDIKSWGFLKESLKESLKDRKYAQGCLRKNFLICCLRGYLWGAVGLQLFTACGPPRSAPSPLGSSQAPAPADPGAPASAPGSAPASGNTTGQGTGQGTPSPTSKGPPQPIHRPAYPCDFLNAFPGLHRISIHSAQDLTTALQAAKPGDLLELSDGTYPGHFVAQTSGRAEAPIVVCGGRQAILDGGDMAHGYTLSLQNASYWVFSGFSVIHGSKGIVTDGSHHNTWIDISVHEIGSEGIHLRRSSTYNLIDHCEVYNTGQASAPHYGEGVYIGSSVNNWCKYMAGQADESHFNTVSHCTIHHTTSENIDIKEGTVGGLIQGNKLSGVGMKHDGATAWINVKGNSYTLVDNEGTDALVDGMQVHVILPGWGICNVFHRNHLTVQTEGYGIHIAGSKADQLPEEVGSDNISSGSNAGLSNVPTDQPILQASCKAGPTHIDCPDT